MRRTNKALTLLELLIASSIFLVVMLTVYSAFHAGMFGYRHIEETIGVCQNARTILERINQDLRNSFAYSDTQARFTGNRKEVGFLTLTDSYSEEKLRRDYSLVSYKIDEGRLMRLCRRDKDSLNEKSEIQPEEMASDIGEFIFSYGYYDPVDGVLKFQDSWAEQEVLQEEQNALPTALKVKFTIKNKTKQDFERIIYLPLAK